MVKITLSASDSQQYKRGWELARTMRERRVSHRGPAAAGRGAMPQVAWMMPPRKAYQAAAIAGGLDHSGRPSRGDGRVPGRQPDFDRPVRRCPRLHLPLSRGVRAIRPRWGPSPSRWASGAWPRRPEAGSRPTPPNAIARRFTVASSPVRSGRSTRPEVRRCPPARARRRAEHRVISPGAMLLNS